MARASTPVGCVAQGSAAGISFSTQVSGGFDGPSTMPNALVSGDEFCAAPHLPRWSTRPSNPFVGLGDWFRHTAGSGLNIGLGSILLI